MKIRGTGFKQLKLRIMAILSLKNISHNIYCIHSHLDKFQMQIEGASLDYRMKRDQQLAKLYNYKIINTFFVIKNLNQITIRNRNKSETSLILEFCLK